MVGHLSRDFRRWYISQCNDPDIRWIEFFWGWKLGDERSIKVTEKWPIFDIARYYLRENVAFLESPELLVNRFTVVSIDPYATIAPVQLHLYHRTRRCVSSFVKSCSTQTYRTKDRAIQSSSRKHTSLPAKRLRRSLDNNRVLLESIEQVGSEYTSKYKGSTGEKWTTEFTSPSRSCAVSLYSMPCAKIITSPGSTIMSSGMCVLSQWRTNTACLPGTLLHT